MALLKRFLKNLILISVAALLVTAAFFILRPGEQVTEFTGEVTGLPQQTDGAPLRIAIFNIIDPTTAFLISGKEVGGELSPYRIETTPGWRMVILRVWGFDSKKLYTGSTRIVNVSEGQTQEADIVLREAGTFLSQNSIAYAADEGPVFAVIARKPEPRGPIVNPAYLDIIGTSLANAGHSVVITDPEFLGQVEEERNLKELPLGTYRDFTPSEPNFAVEVEYRRHELRDPIVTISIRNLENGEVFWQETTDSRIDTQTNYEMYKVYELATSRLVESVAGKGPNPVKLPAFTPSVPKPISMAEWGVRLKKLLGLDKESWTTGGVKTPSPAVVPKQTCDFNGFVSCRDTFNLQGCIDACPFVDAACPAGTPPDTECKQTDGECSNKCWDQGNSHGSQCAVTNHCSMQEIDKGLRAD